MKRSHIKQLFSKFLKKDISPLEESILERFDHEMIKSNPNIKTSDKEEVWSHIQRQIAKERPLIPSNFYRVAASLLLLISLGFAVTYFLEEDDTENPETEWVEHHTANGEKLDLRLSDGSTIRVNSRTTIAFPKDFESGKERSIRLDGEAYFKVARNPNRPFVIHSKTNTTEVLGTSFNISAYGDELAVIAVESGIVAVKDTLNNQIELSKNQQVKVVQGNLKKSIIDFPETISWLRNILKFENATPREIFEALEKWYGYKFIYEGDWSLQGTYNITFSNQPMDYALLELAHLFCMDYDISKVSKQIQITKTVCP